MNHRKATDATLTCCFALHGEATGHVQQFCPELHQWELFLQ